MSIRPLPKELQEVAKNELNEDFNRIQDDLNYIREWVTKQPYLNARNEDKWYINFLRHSKFSLERAKEKLDQYYTMRSIAPEVYKRDPLSPELQEILERGIVTVIIDESKPLLPALMVVRWSKTDPAKISVLNILKVIVMLLDVMQNENDNVIISGLHFLADMKGLPLGYLPQFTPSMNKSFIMSLQDTNPVRLKGLHFTNVPSVAEVALNICKSFLKDKMISRFHLYGGNLKDLRRHIPPAIIPKEYDGEACLLDEIKDKWKMKLESYRDWFLDDAKYGTDESKRPGKPKLASEIFGVDGSFRKLNID